MFTIDSKHSCTAYCRNLAPLYGIDEESATGTSSGALASYLHKYGILNESNYKNIFFYQGYVMDRPSEITVNLSVEGDQINKVQVGGMALNLEKIYVEI